MIPNVPSQVNNTQLNRAGFFWAHKFRNKSYAVECAKQYPVGKAQQHYSARSKRPHWVLIKSFNEYMNLESVLLDAECRAEEQFELECQKNMEINWAASQEKANNEND